VLADPERDDDTLTARLAPRFDHPSLFDHSYDHYPAMVLMEAARQLSLLALDGTGRDAVATGFDAGFERFAELDAPITARARPAGDGGGDRAARAATEVIFEQRGERIARSTVELADPADPRRRKAA
jgi:2-oxo-3-(phosphooxy)propyl 3-oxoalkanoate synthase